MAREKREAPTPRTKTKTVEVEEYSLRLYTFFGSFDVYYPIPRVKFVADSAAALAQADINFVGWFDFELIDSDNTENQTSKFISLNLRDIRGVEDL